MNTRSDFEEFGNDSAFAGLHRDKGCLLIYTYKDVSKIGFDEELAKQCTAAAAGSEAAAKPCSNLMTSVTSSK
jgi:hypothetical protein